MVTLLRKMRQTVTLVESRVKENKSEDPIKDLAFLSEHYRTTHEWDKANAATRHMLAVAEGKTSSFEITPVDIELHRSRKHWRNKSMRTGLLNLHRICSGWNQWALTNNGTIAGLYWSG